MKKIFQHSLTLIALAIVGMLGACSDYTPKGYDYPEGIEPAKELTATVADRIVNLAWTLPAAEGITGVQVTINGNAHSAVTLDGPATSYSVKGQPMGEEVIYTVKVLYEGNHISEGVSVVTAVPEENLPDVTNLRSSVAGRAVTLSWTLPQASGITGVRILRDGDEASATTVEGEQTSFVLKAQPMDQELTYTVQVVYDYYYASEGTSVKTTVPYITPKMGYLMTAASIADLPDDDERAAATWFVGQPNAELIYPSQLADLDPDIYSVLWIEIDRVGLPLGWENLPSEVSSADAIDALRRYSAAGGSLYLANMATQLTVPLGIVPADMAPTVYGNGDGGSGDDVWVINPYLGVDFKDGGDQGYYDRTAHAIYKGLTFEDPNNYGYLNLPLIGPGQREDHNCLWDCNIYGRGSYPDVIKNFEVTTNSLVLATWGHVRDHCVAGLVEFYANAEHGRCIANGFAAYEWNQNSGANPYQGNVEKLTSNILDYLK